MAESGINSDFTLFARRNTAEMTWQASPSTSVWRKRLDHLGENAESGRVTSIVRFDSKSSFSLHDHPDGEEILVLDGVFPTSTAIIPRVRSCSTQPGSDTHRARRTAASYSSNYASIPGSTGRR